MGIYFLGFAAGVLLWGWLCDAWGRRPALLAGLCTGLAGTLCAAWAPGFEALLAGRFVQALGLATCSITTQTMLRDRLQGEALTRCFIMLGAVLSWSPALGPLAGQLLADQAGFRGVLGGIAALAGLLLAAGWARVGETRTAGGAPAHAPAGGPHAARRRTAMHGHAGGRPEPAGLLVLCCRPLHDGAAAVAGVRLDRHGRGAGRHPRRAMEPAPAGSQGPARRWRWACAAWRSAWRRRDWQSGSRPCPASGGPWPRCPSSPATAWPSPTCWDRRCDATATAWPGRRAVQPGLLPAGAAAGGDVVAASARPCRWRWPGRVALAGGLHRLRGRLS